MNTEELHILVMGLTGCESITELTDRQAEEIIDELRKRRGNSPEPPEKRNPNGLGVSIIHGAIDALKAVELSAALNIIEKNYREKFGTI